eukprot:GHVN01031302.1.p1 GENE.GHVN01031302.1~~GHVN01031302.1.p1  ORF type:complete len:154 (+),score=19.63 GHVN01031302.1:483-944(+)
MVSSRPVCRYNNTSKNWFKGEQCTFEHNRTPEAEEQRLMAARAKRNKQGTVQVTGDSNHIKGQGTVRPDGNEVIMQTPNGVMSGNEGMVETALAVKEGWVLPGTPSFFSCGKLCQTEGYCFLWPPLPTHSHRYSHGMNIPLTVTNFAPLVTPV